jgi:Aldehyde dehydrogenase family
MMSHIPGTGGEDLRDASVSRAAEGAVRACFASAGQLCVSMERIFIAQRWVEFFADNNSDERDYRIGEKIVKSARTSDVAWTIRDWTHRCITATLIATTVGVASSEMTTDISRRVGKSTDRICLTIRSFGSWNAMRVALSIWSCSGPAPFSASSRIVRLAAYSGPFLR